MMRRLRNDAGLSTLETLIYIAGSLLLVGMATALMRNMTHGFQRGTQTVRMQQGAREAINLMTREIRNTGLKRAFYPDGSGGFRDTILSGVSLGSADSSSFTYTDGTRFDGLTFRQARLDEDGRPLGVDTVAYRVDASRSMLQRKLNTGGFEDFCPNLDALQFQYGVYAVRTNFFNENPPVPAGWNATGKASLSFGPSSMTLQTDGSGIGSVIQANAGFSIEAGKTYFCEMIISGDEDFFANASSLDMVIVDGGGKVLKSEPFLPGRSPVKRRLEITAAAATGCHAGIRVNARGPITLRFSRIRFGELNLGRYTWKNFPNLTDKRSVRAVRILLMAKTTQPMQGVTGSDYGIANTVVTVADGFLRRYFEEVVPIPNNGLF